MPRLLQRNQRAIAGTIAAGQRARLLAQRASLLARHWRSDELPAALAHAEAAVEASGDPVARAELALARGVARYYGTGVDQSADAFKLALALAQAAGETGIEAECEAWLGCVGATLQHEPAAVLLHLVRARQLGAHARPLAAARADYVLASLCQEAGLMEQASARYRDASRIAREQGDEQLLAAVVRFMTLAQVQQLRRAQAAGRPDEELRRQTLVALRSARDLASTLTGDERCLQFALRTGEAHRVGGEHHEALAAFGHHVDEAEQRGMTWEATVARADQAVCLAATGQHEAARRAEAQARAALPQVLDAYHNAVIHGSLAELAQRLDDPAEAAARAAEAADWWARDRAYCARLRTELAALAD